MNPSSFLFDPTTDAGFNGWTGATRLVTNGTPWPFYVETAMLNPQGDQALAYLLSLKGDPNFATQFADTGHPTVDTDGPAVDQPNAYFVDVDPDTGFGGLVGYWATAMNGLGNGYFPMRFPEFAFDTYRNQRRNGDSVSASLAAAKAVSAGHWGTKQSPVIVDRLIAAHQENESTAAYVLDSSDPTGMLASFQSETGKYPDRQSIARAAGLSESDVASFAPFKVNAAIFMLANMPNPSRGSRTGVATSSTPRTTTTTRSGADDLNLTLPSPLATGPSRGEMAAPIIGAALGGILALVVAPKHGLLLAAGGAAAGYLGFQRYLAFNPAT